MKFCIFLLRFSIGLLLLSFVLFIKFYCIGDNGPEPVEVELIIIGLIPVLGILSSWLLIKKSGSMKRVWFGLAFVFHLLVFTFPAIVMSIFMIAMATAG